MAETPTPRKIPLLFFCSPTGSEPVREWLRGWWKKSGRRLGEICCGRSGDGQSECRFAGR